MLKKNVCFFQLYSLLVVRRNKRWKLYVKVLKVGESIQSLCILDNFDIFVKGHSILLPLLAAGVFFQTIMCVSVHSGIIDESVVSANKPCAAAISFPLC